MNVESGISVLQEENEYPKDCRLLLLLLARLFTGKILFVSKQIQFIHLLMWRVFVILTFFFVFHCSLPCETLSI